MPENFDLSSTLQRAHQTILPSHNGAVKFNHPPEGPLFSGVGLGTANLVLVALVSQLQPIAGEYQLAQVVRDGLVVDYFGSIERMKFMKARVEERIGRAITSAATAFPPGVAQAEVRATANVVQAAGLACDTVIDEPSAANNLLGIRDGAIVDVGGGTTGIAIVRDGETVYTADEFTGGTHLTLLLAGAKDIPFEEAEAYKLDPRNEQELFPLLRPVMEKVASITARHLAGRNVTSITLMGGAASIKGMANVVEEYTDIPTAAVDKPLFVTPIGIAMQQAILN